MAKQNSYPQDPKKISPKTQPAFWGKGGNRPGNGRDRMRPGDKTGDK